MNKAGRWLIWLTIIMFVSFIVAGFFFLKSGLIHPVTGNVNSEIVIELEKFNFEFNDFFGIPNYYENCYLDWCLENNSKTKT